MAQTDRDILFSNEAFVIGMLQAVSGAGFVAAISQSQALVALSGTTAFLLLITSMAFALMLAMMAAYCKHQYKLWDVKAQVSASQDEPVEMERRSTKSGRYLKAMRRLMVIALVMIMLGMVELVAGVWFHHVPAIARMQLWKGNTAQNNRAMLHQGMTMLEVEELLDKPDRVEIEQGGIEGTHERPKVIKWTYSKYRVTDSGEGFGQPGHIKFIPLRFTQHGWNDSESDKIAREHGEQADTFRTYAFRGSFRVDRDNWELAGRFDGIPLKDIKK